ncbi:MAG: hypothetical protein HOQ11_15320 [Gemmatimonadaceae bacterium]|nr:hypothetical protein [Gemmatimonadaceae bacterium]
MQRAAMIHGSIPTYLDTADGGGFLDFVDPTYVQWRESERDARHDPGAKADVSRIGSCTGTGRRVWDYPADWRTLHASDLLALSWRR